jgi:glycosyltransferase involved in cell wall biosynthesis
MLISIIVPLYNEESNILPFYQKLDATINQIEHEFEILFVNDGSSDSSINILKKLQKKHKNISIIDLSRNFGKEIAITAGLDHCRGDAAVIMDADLQHPPYLIKELVDNWQDGYEVVYTVNDTREDEDFHKRSLTKAFYKILNLFSSYKIPENAGDFRLLDRKAIDAITKFREQHRFMKGLYSFIGYKQKAISYKPEMRYSGSTKWNYFKLINFAIEGITSFSSSPLRIATYLGIVCATFAFVYALEIIIQTIFYGNPVSGYPSIMVMILFLGGVQLICLGIIGEYIGRVFDETKTRPLYIIREHIAAENNKLRKRIDS